MIWADNLAALAQYAGDSALASDADFLTAVPRFIEAGEQRILRDLDLLAAVVTDSSGYVAANRRRFMLPTATGTFIVFQGLRLVVNNQTQSPLLPISRTALDWLFPDDTAPSVPSVPVYWAPNDQVSVLVAPAPDQQYQARCTGTMRPQSLSVGATINANAGTATIAANTPAAIGTFISVVLPDLLIASEMIAVSAWQRQFSGIADNPAQAVAWTAEYERLKNDALIEEAKKKLALSGWAVPGQQPAPQR